MLPFFQLLSGSASVEASLSTGIQSVTARLTGASRKRLQLLFIDVVAGHDLVLNAASFGNIPFDFDGVVRLDGISTSLTVDALMNASISIVDMFKLSVRLWFAASVLSHHLRIPCRPIIQWAYQRSRMSPSPILI